METADFFHKTKVFQQWMSGRQKDSWKWTTETQGGVQTSDLSKLMLQSLLFKTIIIYQPESKDQLLYKHLKAWLCLI